VVQDISWSHLDSMKLLNSFNIVLMMDSILKTNKYMTPLLEVVCVALTRLTFLLLHLFYQYLNMKITLC